jgi:hypothetical protein
MEEKGPFAQFFLSFLVEIRDTQAQALALAVLRQGKSRLSLVELTEMARRLGQDPDPSRVRRVCDALVIQNILAWEGVYYRPANQALEHFAEQAGLLGKTSPLVPA